MTDFGEKAGEAGFDDDVEYFDYLCDETSKEMQHEYQESLVEEARSEAAFLESRKSALALSNFDKISNDIGFHVIHNLGLKLHAADVEDSEVARNLEFYQVKQGNILDIVYSPKEDIIRYNNLFNVKFSIEDVFDDVYFIKHTNHHNMDIWVGSPIKDSDEISFIMNMKNYGFIIKALVTQSIDVYNYTYCLIQKSTILDSIFKVVEEAEEF